VCCTWVWNRLVYIKWYITRFVAKIPLMKHWTDSISMQKWRGTDSRIFIKKYRCELNWPMLQVRLMIKFDETVKDLGVQIVNLTQTFFTNRPIRTFSLSKYAWNLKHGKLCPLNGIILICPKLGAVHLTTYHVSHPLLAKIFVW
jgi:hypothetical protein